MFLPDTGSPDLPDWARQGAVEIKASWRILDKAKDIPGRYFTTRAAFLKPNGEVSAPLTLGLVGLHILRNTPRSKSTWAWTTFEQVDNVRILDRPVPDEAGWSAARRLRSTPGRREPSRRMSLASTSTGRFDYRLLSSAAAYYNPVTSPAMLSQGDVIPRNPPDRPVNLSRVFPIREAVKKIERRVPVRSWGNRLAVLRDDRRAVPDRHRHERGLEAGQHVVESRSCWSIRRR